MTTPSKSPRTFVEEPHLFGETHHLTWRITDDNAGLAQAQLQNKAALAIRNAVRVTYPGRSGLRTYARVTQRNYGQLLRVLRGETTMTLRDLADAQRFLSLTIELTAPSRPKPPDHDRDRVDDLLKQLDHDFENTDITKALHAEGTASIYRTNDGTIVIHHPDGHIEKVDPSAGS